MRSRFSWKLINNSSALWLFLFSRQDRGRNAATLIYKEKRKRVNRSLHFLFSSRMPFGTARSSAGVEEDVEELSSWSLLLRRWSQVPSLYDLPLEISSSERRQMELRGRRGSCLGRVERLVARESDRYAAGSSRRVSTGSLLEGF